jgi:hypothetical protein
MRRKLATCLGLILLALVVAVLAAWWLPPAEPPLRVGMTEKEVDAVLAPKTSSSEPCRDCRPFRLPASYAKVYWPGWADWRGHYQTVRVWFDNDGRAVEWKIENGSGARPSWLDRQDRAIKKWAGW